MVFQNDGKNDGQAGSSKLELPMIELFMNQFDSNLNRRHKIKCLKITSKCFQNGGHVGCQNGGSKLELLIIEP